MKRLIVLVASCLVFSLLALLLVFIFSKGEDEALPSSQLPAVTTQTSSSFPQDSSTPASSGFSSSEIAPAQTWKKYDVEVHQLDSAASVTKTVTAKVSLPDGLFLENGSRIRQSEGVIPQSVLDTTVETNDFFYGNTPAHFTLWHEEDLAIMRNAGEDGYDVFSMGETVHYRYSNTFENYTYFYYNSDFIVTTTPSPGVGGPLPSLCFHHMPTGLTLVCPFSGNGADAYNYYVDIIPTVSF